MCVVTSTKRFYFSVTKREKVICVWVPLQRFDIRTIYNMKDAEFLFYFYLFSLSPTVSWRHFGFGLVIGCFASLDFRRMTFAPPTAAAVAAAPFITWNLSCFTKGRTRTSRTRTSVQYIGLTVATRRRKVTSSTVRSQLPLLAKSSRRVNASVPGWAIPRRRVTAGRTLPEAAVQLYRRQICRKWVSEIIINVRIT